MVVITYYNARDDGNGEIRGIRGGQYMKDLSVRLVPSQARLGERRLHEA